MKDAASQRSSWKEWLTPKDSVKRLYKIAASCLVRGKILVSPPTVPGLNVCISYIVSWVCNAKVTWHSPPGTERCWPSTPSQDPGTRCLGLTPIQDQDEIRTQRVEKVPSSALQFQASPWHLFPTLPSIFLLFLSFSFYSCRKTQNFQILIRIVLSFMLSIPSTIEERQHWYIVEIKFNCLFLEQANQTFRCSQQEALLSHIKCKIKIFLFTVVWWRYGFYSKSQKDLYSSPVNRTYLELEDVTFCLQDRVAFSVSPKLPRGGRN